MLCFQVDIGPNFPGFVQLRSVHSSSYEFCMAVPVKPILHRALISFIASVVSALRPLIW